MLTWMTTCVVLFNLTMVGIDGAMLVWLYHRRTTRCWWGCAATWGAAVATLVALLTESHFDTAELASHAMFGHAVVYLAGSAWLIRRVARKTAILAAVACAVLVAVAVEALLIEPTWLEATHYELRSPKIQRPVRIVVLADFQTDQCGSYERHVLEQVLREEPDVILLAGDYLQASPSELPALQKKVNALLRELHFRAPEGVFAVQGNADIWYPWMQLFQGLPIYRARSTWSIDVAGLRLTCLSVGDSFWPRLQLPNNDPNRYHVVLGHCPQFAMGNVEADLLLAGHTHGGQVQLPWIGPLTTGCKVPRSWADGLTELPGGRKLIVSRGTGMERGCAPRIRFFCRPELVVIDLMPE
jgi:uncharacterized protein